VRIEPALQPQIRNSPDRTGNRWIGGFHIGCFPEQRYRNRIQVCEVQRIGSPEDDRPGFDGVPRSRRMGEDHEERDDAESFLGEIREAVCTSVPEHRHTVNTTGVGVFVDRDGTLNEERDFVRTPDELSLLPGAARAIRMLNERGIVTCVISNQSGVARGYLSEADLRDIHTKLEADLKSGGARLNKIYYCPHHPTAGLPPYNVACECRKPAPGMLRQGAEEFHLDLRRSFVVGDSMVDMKAGLAVGARTLLVLTGYGQQTRELCTQHNVHPEVICDTLRDAVDYIIHSLDGEETSHA
jgi:D-glycero-D-manno-heptose 1,7-bisphosphate phosphatase